MTAAYGLDARVKELTRTHYHPDHPGEPLHTEPVLGCAKCVAADRVTAARIVLDNVRPAAEDWRDPEAADTDARRLLAALDMAAHEGIVAPDPDALCLSCAGIVPAHPELPLPADVSSRVVAGYPALVTAEVEASYTDGRCTASSWRPAGQRPRLLGYEHVYGPGGHNRCRYDELPHTEHADEWGNVFTLGPGDTFRSVRQGEPLHPARPLHEDTTGGMG
jgi:hypothetical protein